MSAARSEGARVSEQSAGSAGAAADGRGPPQQSPQADGDRLPGTGHDRGAAPGLGCRRSEEREWVDQMVRRVLAREARVGRTAR